MISYEKNLKNIELDFVQTSTIRKNLKYFHNFECKQDSWRKQILYCRIKMCAKIVKNIEGIQEISKNSKHAGKLS